MYARLVSMYEFLYAYNCFSESSYHTHERDSTVCHIMYVFMHTLLMSILTYNAEIKTNEYPPAASGAAPLCLRGEPDYAFLVWLVSSLK